MAKGGQVAAARVIAYKPDLDLAVLRGDGVASTHAREFSGLTMSAIGFRPPPTTP
jgi:hypothetical protein